MATVTGRKATDKVLEGLLKRKDLLNAELNAVCTDFKEKCEGRFAELEVRIAWKKVEDVNKQLVATNEEFLRLAAVSLTDEELKKEFIEIRQSKQTFFECEVLFEQRNSKKPDPEVKKEVYQLPKLELRVFDGAPNGWLPFWHQFQRIHDDINISKGDKLQYLHQFTSGKVRELVSSYPQLEENYDRIFQHIKERFANNKLLIRYYVNEILKLVIGNKSKGNIECLYRTLETKLRALNTLGVTSDRYCDLLLPLVEAALPEDILILWHRQESHDLEGEGELESLLKFLGKEVEGRCRVEEAGLSFSCNKVVKTSGKVAEKGGTVSALVQVAETNVSCLFCGKTNHKSLRCFTAKRMNVEERKNMVLKKGACFRCLKIGHRANSCQSDIKCSLCEGKHGSLLCSQTEKRHNKEESLSCLSSRLSGARGYLPTVMVRVGRGEHFKMVRALIDSGCQRSYVLESLAKELKLTSLGQESVANCLFGGMVSKKKNYNLYEFSVNDLKGEFSLRVQALGEVVICKFVPSVGKDVADEFPEVTFTDVEKKEEISLVLGADVFGEVFTGFSTIRRDGLTASETRFGWVLTGLRNKGTEMNMMNICLKNSLLPNLWELELLGIKEPVTDSSEDEALLHFRENLTRDISGRYTVALPWLLNRSVLLDNREIAESRLRRMSKKLFKNKLEVAYQMIVEEWQRLDIIEVVPDEEVERPAHYLAHRPVVRMSKETTKVRPVFDASCHKEGFPSLNDCLSKGPNLLELIVPLLIKFRLHKFGLVADIEKAFLQIGLAEKDRDFVRFLWWKKGKLGKQLEIYRHKRLVFGVCCSPFLLSATIAHHLEQYREKEGKTQEIANKLASSLYVDDCVLSLESMDDVRMFVSEAERVMNEARFNLRGWKYNDGQCKTTIEGNETSVLGLLWDIASDTLRCGVEGVEISFKEPFTKRRLLSLTNKIFDPLGFLSPVLLVLKLMLQETWKIKLSWDEELPAECNNKLKLWVKQIPSLRECRIPRWVSDEAVEWERCSLHVFCDASSLAYAACVFLRAEGRSVTTVRLLLAKSRVAPLKETTIPRLELLGALVGTRLATTVSKVLPVGLPITFWTDSRVVLAWIKRKEPWSVFVRNRIEEIRKVADGEKWRHVPGSLNPADLASRGCHAAKLVEKDWWSGPSWLLSEPEEWPQEEGVPEEVEVMRERRGVNMMAVKNDCPLDCFIRYFSSYRKIVRMCAWMFRFVNRLRFLVWLKNDEHVEKGEEIQQKFEALSGELSNDEIIAAELTLLKLVQQECIDMNDLKAFGAVKLFKDEGGIVRIQTRLTEGLNENYVRNPIVLVDHELVRRMIWGIHMDLAHAGVSITLSKLRERFFVLGGRRLVRRIVKACVVCRKVLSKPFTVPEAPLPMERTNTVAAFQVTGVDLGGPLYLRKSGKAWFAVFTCAVYRAVHLEIMTQLTTEAFVMALRRFIARRGRPSIIYSDRGTNFVGTNNLLNRLNWKHLQKEKALQRITWRFNPPAAPWWGGWWERLVGLVKTALKKTVGRAYLSYVELETILCDIESVLNTKPLTYMSEDPKDLEAITPAHFIQDYAGCETVDLDKVDKRFLGKRLKYICGVREHLRNRFRREYLSNLVIKQKRLRGTTSVIKVGDVVLVEDSLRKRMNWPLGKVLELIPGRDGISRVAKLKVESGQLVRPVQRLYPLEIDTTCADVLTETLQKTRSGREVKPVQRLDL